jgi:hypothetical protein
MSAKKNPETCWSRGISVFILFNIISNISNSMIVAEVVADESSIVNSPGIYIYLLFTIISNNSIVVIVVVIEFINNNWLVH